MRADWQVARARAAMVIRDYEKGRKAGVTAVELGKRYGLSHARVWQILYRHFGYLRKL
jgi:hypothetical protein